MREDKWRKEDQARVNLLKNVYDNRSMHIGMTHLISNIINIVIDMKQKYKDEEKWKLNNEK